MHIFHNTDKLNKTVIPHLLQKYPTLNKTDVIDNILPAFAQWLDPVIKSIKILIGKVLLNGQNNQFDINTILSSDKRLIRYQLYNKYKLEDFYVIKFGANFYGKDFDTFVNDFMEVFNHNAIPLLIRNNSQLLDSIIHLIKCDILFAIGKLSCYITIATFIENLYKSVINSVIKLIVTMIRKNETITHDNILRELSFAGIDLIKHFSVNYLNGTQILFDRIKIIYDMFYPIVKRTNWMAVLDKCPDWPCINFFYAPKKISDDFILTKHPFILLPFAHLIDEDDDSDKTYDLKPKLYHIKHSKIIIEV